jgi:4-amino-4-deoxy-L-arabinose transferase-like glycosyltransferase
VTVPETSPRRVSAGHWQELFFCFVVATGAAWLTSLLWYPLERVLAEEYIDLARTLYSTGSFESLLRPPGYVAFLSLVAFFDPAILANNYVSVFLLQGVIHGLTTAIIREEIGWTNAGRGPQLVALAFGLSPIALIGAGYLHYDTLHVFLLVLAAASGRKAFESEGRLRDAFLAGAVAAILALVRPMTLPWIFILPAVTFLVCRERGRLIWMRTALLLLGFACAIAPHTIHNLRKTGRLILVNSQSGAALWPMTEVELSPDSETFPWFRLWYDIGRPVVAARFSGLSETEDPFQRDTVATNDILLERSAENLGKSPLRYVRNVARNAWFFVTGNNSQFVRHFRIGQGRGYFFDPLRKFCVVSNELLVRWIGLFVVIAALIAGKRRYMSACSLLACLWMVHSALYLDFRYLYSQTALWILVTGIALFSDGGFDRESWIGRIFSVVPVVLISSSLIAFLATYF